MKPVLQGATALAQGEAECADARGELPRLSGLNGCMHCSIQFTRLHGVDHGRDHFGISRHCRNGHSLPPFTQVQHTGPVADGEARRRSLSL